MNKYPKIRIKVHPKIRKLNDLIVEVLDYTMLMIVLTSKISKNLCRLFGVILTLKRVFP